MTERVIQATAVSFVISPSALGGVAPEPSRGANHFSPRWMLAVAARLVQDVGTLITRSSLAHKPLPTLTVDSDLRFASVYWPASSAAAGSFDRVRAALGLVDGATAGDGVPAVLPGIASDSATVDFWNDNFVGLRTSYALYRFLGCNAFGAPVGVTVHHFGTADATALQDSRQDWLDRIFD